MDLKPRVLKYFSVVRVFFQTRFEAVVKSVKRIFQKRSEAKDLIIGQILVSQRIITEDQLQKALDLQRMRLIQSGRAVQLGVLIVELGFADEKHIVKALNTQYSLTFTSLSDNIRGRISRLRSTIKKPRIPIWLQLAIGTVIGILLAMSVLSYVVLTRQREQLYNNAVKTGLISLNYFDNNAKVPLIQDDLLSLNTLIKDAERVSGVNYVFITSEKGRIKAHTNSAMIGQQFHNFKNIHTIQQKEDVTYFTYATETGNLVLNLNRPVMFNKKKFGEVHVGLSIDFIQELIEKERTLILGVTSFIVVFAILMAIGLALRFSRPISKLVTATEEFGDGNYRFRVTENRNDELGNLASAFNRMGEQLFRQSLMKETFGKYVGQEVLDLIMANPETTWLKGYRNQATILFADIRGFTSYSDHREPEDVVEKLSEFFDIVTRVIQAHDGYIDKFMGDSVLGVFGVPVYRNDHIQRAVRAAVELQHALSSGVNSRNPLLTSVGIGIDTGVVVSGNIGSQCKMEYTVIGDCVNVASRLSGLAQGGEVLISRSVADDLSANFQLTPRPPQKIKGKPEPVETFQVNHA